MFLYVFVGVLLACNTQAATSDCTWTNNNGAGDSNWGTATNWSCGAVPNNTYNVILSGTYDYPLTINSAATAAAFSVNSGYTQTITANSSLTLDTSQGGTGTFTLSGGTYSANDTTLTVPGSWNSSGGTFTAGSSTVTFTATTSGKTITSGANQFSTVTFNGMSPGAWTLQDNVTASSLTLTTGNLIDNGKTVTVNGSISIANTSSLLTSTGSWVQGGSGSISNPHLSNNFKNLSIAGSRVTTTMTGNVWVGFTSGGTLTIGPGTLFGAGKVLYFYTASNSALTVSAPTIGSSLGGFYYVLSASVTQGAITLPNGFGGVIINTNGRNLTATGDFNFGNSSLAVYDASSPGTPTKYVDMSSFSLTSGSLFIGATTSNGYLKLGSSALHSVSSIARNGTGTANILDMANSTLTCSGNVNFTGINVTPGTSTLTMTGVASAITSAGQPLNNLIYNSSGGTLTLSDNTALNGNLTITAGTVSAGSTTVSSPLK